jgi:RNA polymerase sigma-70 factor (ECF subfamily)
VFFKGKNIERMTDLELIAEYQRSDNNRTVGILFERYSHLVFGVCLKYLKNQPEAQDSVIQIFEKLLIDLKTNEISNFKSWLHTVSRNHCLMFIRKHKKQWSKEQDMETAEHFLESEDKMPEVQAKELQLTELEQAIQQLKPDQRAVIELFYIKEKCYNEVAQITGFTLKQVKSYVQNGKRNLKIILTTKNELVR